MVGSSAPVSAQTTPGAAAAFDNRAGMTETCSFPGRLATDIGDQWLGNFPIGDQLRKFLFL